MIMYCDGDEEDIHLYDNAPYNVSSIFSDKPTRFNTVPFT